MSPWASTQLPWADRESHRATTWPRLSIRLIRGDSPLTPPSLMQKSPSRSMEMSSGRRMSVHIVRYCPSGAKTWMRLFSRSQT